MRAASLRLFAELGIPWHAGIEDGPSNHLLDSQVQCVNALARMVDDEARIRAAFGNALDIDSVQEVEPGRFLTFEYIGSKDYFGEGWGKPRRRGTRCTSVDAAITYRTSVGISELAIIEWKFTEDYRTARYDGGHVKTRRHRYGARYEDSDGPLRSYLLAFEDMLSEPFYQLMRQQLLADAIEGDPDEPVDVVRIVHVLSPQNLAYQGSLRPVHRKLGDNVEQVWHRLLRRSDRYVRLDPVVFLDPAITSDEYVARYRIDATT